MTDEQNAAVATLKQLGYTFHGGEYWKPPIGQAPDFQSVDYWRGQVDNLTRQNKGFATQHAIDSKTLRSLCHERDRLKSYLQAALQRVDNHTKMIAGYQDELMALKKTLKSS